VPKLDPFSTPWNGLEKGNFLSVMDGVDVLMALQRRHKLTKAAMRDIFDAVEALTVGCNLCSYDDAIKFTKQYGITQAATSVDACVNDCCLFRGDLEPSNVCPQCNESRFDADKTARKAFRYFPLPATLRQQFLDSAFANKVRLQNNVSGLPPSDLHGSQGWREKVLGDREFMQECRDLVFSFCADGVNPFGKSVQYSMWPLMLRNENVSAKTRYKYDNFLLWGLIPGEYIVSSLNGVKHRERRHTWTSWLRNCSSLTLASRATMAAFQSVTGSFRCSSLRSCDDVLVFMASLLSAVS
jgi:hypothetical protein